MKISNLVFLYIDLYSMGKTWYFPESTIPYNMLRYIVSGSAEFIINGKKYTVKENDVVYIPNGCRLTCKMITEKFEFYSMRFVSSLSYMDEDILKNTYGIKTITNNPELKKYFEVILYWIKTKHISRNCFVRGYMYTLIGLL